MEQTRNPKKTILLLDDEEIERAVARQFLHDAGYTVLEADSYQSALSLFESNRKEIDLLIADISLPDGNGCDLAVAARLQKKSLRVLFISGHVGAEVCRFYGLEITDLHYLRKPFGENELIDTVRKVLQADARYPRLVAKTRTA